MDIMSRKKASGETQALTKGNATTHVCEGGPPVSGSKQPAMLSSHKSGLDIVSDTLPFIDDVPDENWPEKCHTHNVTTSNILVSQDNSTSNPLKPEEDINANVSSLKDKCQENASVIVPRTEPGKPQPQTCPANKHAIRMQIDKEPETTHLHVQGDVMAKNEGWYEVCLDEEKADEVATESGPPGQHSSHVPPLPADSSASALLKTLQVVSHLPSAYRASVLAQKKLHIFASPRQHLDQMASPPKSSVQKPPLSQATQQSVVSVQSSGLSRVPVKPTTVDGSVIQLPLSASVAGTPKSRPVQQTAATAGAADLPHSTPSSLTPTSERTRAILTFKPASRSERSCKAFKMGWILGVRRNHPNHPSPCSPHHYGSKVAMLQHSLSNDRTMSHGISSRMEGMAYELKTFNHHQQSDQSFVAEEIHNNNAATKHAEAAFPKRTNLCQSGPATAVMLATGRHLLHEAKQARQRLGRQVLSALMCGMLESTSRQHPALERCLDRLHQQR